MSHIVRRWSNEDVAKLKSMAQKFPAAVIAAELGRSPSSTVVKAHELKLSLRVRSEKKTRNIDPSPAGIELPSD